MKETFDIMREPKLELKIWREERRTKRSRSLYVREKMMAEGRREEREVREVPPAPQQPEQQPRFNPRLDAAFQQLLGLAATPAATTTTGIAQAGDVAWETWGTTRAER